MHVTSPWNLIICHTRKEVNYFSQSSSQSYKSIYINLIEKYAGGSFDGDFLDVNHADLNNDSIILKSSEIKQILGISLEKELTLFLFLASTRTRIRGSVPLGLI